MDVLRSWINRKSSGILIGEAHGIKTSSRDFAVDLLDVIMKARIPAIWALPQPTEEEESTVTVEDLLVSLVLQAINLNPSVLSEGVNPISATHFRTIGSVEKLLQLLQRSVKGLKFTIVVVDLMLLKRVLRKSKSLEPEEFLEMLLDMTESHDGIIKIVVLTWRSEAIISETRRESFAADMVVTDPGFRKVRLMKNPQFRIVYNARRGRLSNALESKLQIGDICNSQSG